MGIKLLKRLSLFLPLLGIIIFLFIIYNTGINSILSAFSKINVLYLVLFVPFFVILITFIRGYKWKLIIKSLNIDYPLMKSIKVILIGFFTGFITPGRVGDMVRSIYLKNDTKSSLAESFSTVFVDRLIDLITVLIMGMLSAIIFSGYLSKNALYGIITASVLMLASLYIATKKRTVKTLFKPFYKLFVPAKYKMKIADNFNAFYNSIARYKNNKKMLFKIITLNICNWLVIFTYTYAIALIAGLDAGFLYIILISPLIVLVEIIPISISGLGTREAAMIFFLSFVNIKSSLAVSYSLLYMVLAGWTFSLIGAVLWLKEPVRIKS